MLHAKPMQQRDQPRPAMILDAAFLLDPGADRARCPWQRLGDPGFQFVLLFVAQAARAALVAEACQALEPVLLMLRRSHNPESTFVSSALDFYRKALVVSATEEFPKRESIPLRFEL
jgi:hypothetical protein